MRVRVYVYVHMPYHICRPGRRSRASRSVAARRVILCAWDGVRQAATCAAPLSPRAAVDGAAFTAPPGGEHVFVPSAAAAAAWPGRVLLPLLGKGEEAGGFELDFRKCGLL